jgi:hypothetical protein
MLQLARAGLRSGHSLPRLVLFALRLAKVRLRSVGWELAGTIADLWRFRHRDRATDLGSSSTGRASSPAASSRRGARTSGGASSPRHGRASSAAGSATGCIRRSCDG